MVGVRPRGGKSIGWLVTTVATLAVFTLPANAAATHQPKPMRPGTYVVSSEPGVLPEGIGLGPRGTFYVTSSGTGAIYRGDLRHRRMQLFVAAGADGRRSALGVHVDQTGRIFVASPAALDVYSRGGQLLAHRSAPDGPVGAPSLNDLVITADAVYITDSANPIVLRASLTHGHVGALKPWVDVSAVEPALPDQYWFLNGIVISHNRRTLLVSSQGLEHLLRVDIAHRAASIVDLGAATFAADGLDLAGTTLYAVLNYDPPAGQGVYIAKLAPDLTHGRVVAASAGQLAPFDSPTTLARAGHRLLVVNSQLDHPPGTPPYTVSTLPIGAGASAQPRP